MCLVYEIFLLRSIRDLSERCFPVQKSTNVAQIHASMEHVTTALTSTHASVNRDTLVQTARLVSVLICHLIRVDQIVRTRIIQFVLMASAAENVRLSGTQ